VFPFRTAAIARSSARTAPDSLGNRVMSPILNNRQFHSATLRNVSYGWDSTAGIGIRTLACHLRPCAESGRERGSNASLRRFSSHRPARGDQHVTHHFDD
jgi:hypothetical protein